MYKSSIKTKRTHCSTPVWKKKSSQDALSKYTSRAAASWAMCVLLACSFGTKRGRGQGQDYACVYIACVYIYISIYIYIKRTYKRVKFTVAIILPKMALHLQGPLLETTMITPTKMQKHKEQEWKMLATETMPGHDETAIDSWTKMLKHTAYDRSVQV